MTPLQTGHISTKNSQPNATQFITKSDKQSQSFEVSLFNSKNDNQPKPYRMSWDDLVEICKNPSIRLNKDGELISPATFIDKRSKANVISVSMIMLDYDHKADWENDLEVFRNHYIQYIAYTSHSHLRVTESNPNAEQRFRVCIPLETPISPDKFNLLFKFFSFFSDGKIDKAASDSSRMFYLPAKSTDDAPYKYQAFNGDPMDWREIDFQVDSELVNEKTSASSIALNLQEILDSFPKDKLDALLQIEPKFNATWNKQRTDLDENNQSQLDMSIANFGVKYDFTDNEIVSLLVKHRGDFKRDCYGRPRKDYYKKTIEKARLFWTNQLETSSENENVELLEDANQHQSIIDSVLAISKKGESNSKQIRDVGLKKEYADAICETDNFAVDAGGLLYVYKNGVYVPDGKRHIEARFKGLANERNQTKSWSSHNAREIAAYISADAKTLLEKPPLEIINLKNGLLYVDLETGKHHLEPHTPNHLSTIQLPVDFDENATCEEWIKFIETTFPDDAKELAWQLLAWLMIPYTSLQLAVLLVGEGSNGKSVLLTAIMSFLGRKNVSNMSLQKIENDRFAVAHLYGKLANLCSDLPSKKLENSSMFKSIVGGDPIRGEHKFERGFEFLPFVRLMFAANHLPESNDTSFAFFRRFLVLPFTRTIAESEQIPREILDDRLSDPRQLSGALNQALKALPNLIKNGLIESASMREAKREFRELTDPLAIWLERNCVLHSDSFVPKSKLLSEYNKDNQKHKRPTITQHAFTKAINRLHPQLSEIQPKIAGKRERCWSGIGLLQKY